MLLKIIKFKKKFHIIALFSIFLTYSFGSIAESIFLKLLFDTKMKQTIIIGTKTELMKDPNTPSGPVWHKYFLNNYQAIPDFHGMAIMELHNELLIFGKDLIKNQLVMLRINEDKDWTPSNILTQNEYTNPIITKIIYNESLRRIFIIGGDDYNAFILTSQLLKSFEHSNSLSAWEQVNLCTCLTSNPTLKNPNRLLDIDCDDAGNLVAVGKNADNVGIIIQSEDGFNWQRSLISKTYTKSINTVSYFPMQRKWLAYGDTTNSFIISLSQKSPYSWSPSYSLYIPTEKNIIPITCFPIKFDFFNFFNFADHKEHHILSVAQKVHDIYSSNSKSPNAFAYPVQTWLLSTLAPKDSAGEEQEGVQNYKKQPYEQISPIKSITAIGANYLALQFKKADNQFSIISYIASQTPLNPIESNYVYEHILGIDNSHDYDINQKQLSSSILIEHFEKYKSHFSVQKESLVKTSANYYGEN